MTQPVGNAIAIVGGTLHTGDDSQPLAEVAVVEGGKFACVGSSRACPIPRGARVIDLHGGSAVPGLADAHGHVVALGRALVEVDLSGAKSERECVDRVVAAARKLPKGAWARGRGWDQTRWPGSRFPTASSLSEAIPDHPVWLVRVDGHAGWANARALELAGITRNTPDPPGGSIVRLADGNPAGVLVDNAEQLVASKIPPLTDAEIEDAIVAAMHRLVRVGLTSVGDAGVDARTLDVYRRMAEAGKLLLRIYAMLDGGGDPAALQAQMDHWRATPEIGWLTVRAVKLFADGAMGSRGALMFEPYSDDASTSGLAVTPADDLARKVSLIAASGFQPCVHAIGDRACAETLRMYADPASGLKGKGLRPRVEHLQVLQAGDVHLLREAEAIASMQPTHATSDGSWAEKRLGRGTARQKGAYAWRQVLDAGGVLACGSDFPVEDPDPRAGLYGAETRMWGPNEPPGGWMPEQRMTRNEALRCYTAAVAYAQHAEGCRGKIKIGYDADLTGWDQDLLRVPADKLKMLSVVFTMVAGKVMYDRQQTSLRGARNGPL